MQQRDILWQMGLIFILLIFSTTTGFANSHNTDTLMTGSGMFAMPEPTGATNDELRVFYHRPANWTPDRPVVIVLHGVKRNASQYCDDWRSYAETYGLLVVCPEFSARKYPGARYYNIGNVTADKENAAFFNPKEEWTFPVIDRVFAEVRLRSGAKREKFILFGHSAGAQFGHRYIYFSRESKAEHIIIANAGWYTMPEREAFFPYGIKNLPLRDEELMQIFARPVIVLLGELDIDPEHKALRHNARVDSQGQSRFDRGQTFFAKAKAKAAELGGPFKWQLITVPGIGHSNRGMAAAAAELIAEKYDIPGRIREISN